MALLLPSLLVGIPSLIFEWYPEILTMNVFAIFPDDLSNKKFELFGFVLNNILNEILGVLVIIGGLAVAFSKEIDEDELIAKMRLESLVWAIYWNYGILLVTFVLVYDFSFLLVMQFNLFTPLILFIAKFNWEVWRFRKSMVHEE